MWTELSAMALVAAGSGADHLPVDLAYPGGGRSSPGRLGRQRTVEQSGGGGAGGTGAPLGAV